VKNDLSFDKHYFNGKWALSNPWKSRDFGSFSRKKNYRSRKIRMAKHSLQSRSTTKEIEEEVWGTFVHYPIKLAGP
jgi:hypothetical protein